MAQPQGTYSARPPRPPPVPPPPASKPPAFEELFAQVLPGAYGVACGLTGNPADAEDLVQEAALRAFRAFDSFIPGTSFKAWFYTILTRRHFERYRHAKRRPATVALDDTPDDLYLFQRTAEAGLHTAYDDPASVVMSRMTTEQVAAAIAGLPAEFGAVATLYFLEDMTHQEMAEILGCPTGTIKSRLHRARRMLQRGLWALAEQSGILGQLSAPGAPA